VKYEEVLEHFKERESENPEALIPLINEKMLQNGVVAWKTVKTEVNSQENCELKGDAQRWEWLWMNVAYDQTKFATIAGVKIHEVTSVLERLIGYRLIYPDGTVNDMANQYLQNEVLKALHTKGKRK
jgi:hypothetical protein